MASLFGAVGMRLRTECEPRHRGEAARAATAMLLLGAGITGLFAIIDPSTARGIGVLVDFAGPAVLVLLGVLVLRTTGRGPSVVWAAAPIVGVLLVAAPHHAVLTCRKDGRSMIR